MYRTLLLAALIVGAGMLPSRTAAQSAPSSTPFVQVVEMRVRVAHAPMYASPRRNARVVNTLAWNERLLALAQVGAFYQVVQPEGGPQGYILNTQLRSAVNPLRADEMPADLRRRQNFIGARLDVSGGIAVPYRSSSFADGFQPGGSIEARLSYPLHGPVGFTARMSYRQLGRGNAPAANGLRLQDVDIQGRDLSLLAGALGLDLTLFRGHLLAFVATVDGGAYHAQVDEAVPALQNPFRAGSTLTWGGSGAFRASLRMGGALRIFAEPGYEVVRAESAWVHMLTARVGISLER